MGGLKTAALDSLLTRRGSPEVGTKEALRVQSAGFLTGSRSLLVVRGFSLPPDENSKVGHTHQICPNGEREGDKDGQVKDRNNNADLKKVR